MKLELKQLPGKIMRLWFGGVISFITLLSAIALGLFFIIGMAVFMGVFGFGPLLLAETYGWGWYLLYIITLPIMFYILMNDA